MTRFLTLFFLLMAVIISAQNHTDFIGAGNTTGVSVKTSSNIDDAQGLRTIDGMGLNSTISLAEASRFLGQSTLGGRYEMIQYVAQIGYENWIDEQIQLPPTYTFPIAKEIQRIQREILEEYADDSTRAEAEQFEFFADKFRYAWWQAAMSAPDELRQRVALALSEIFVISDQSDLIDFAQALSTFYDILIEESLGNFRDLLMKVTLHPAMGYYLSHLNNPRTIEAYNIHPDENYAREIMQLFTIGLYELNQDGSKKVDSSGNYIPTYDNDDVKEFAKIFTGLGDGHPYGEFFSFLVDPASAALPMKMYEEWHEPGEKYLLNDFIVPAGLKGMEDIEMTIDHLFHHPNVGPFIGKQLIQRLVTSNPSPAYVQRIAEVFADNGNGERGDMAAVIKAILLDDEARHCQQIVHPTHGFLREPIIRYTNFLRTLGATSPSGKYWNFAYYFKMQMKQFPLSAPSVFNFFTPIYQPNGPIAEANLVAPEFQLHNSATAVAWLNMLEAWIHGDFIMEEPQIFDFLGLETPEDCIVSIDYSILEFLSRDSDDFMDILDLVFTNGRLSTATRNIIVEAITPLDIEPKYKVRMALYLLLLSPDYTIFK